VLRGDDLRTWSKTIDLDAVEREDELLRFTECDAVGRGACLASLTHSFADIEGDASSSAHLAAEVGFSTRKLVDDRADSSVEFQCAPIHIELVEVVSAMPMRTGVRSLSGGRRRAAVCPDAGSASYKDAGRGLVDWSSCSVDARASPWSVVRPPSPVVRDRGPCLRTP
jgi:hypothetical protein